VAAVSGKSRVGWRLIVAWAVVGVATVGAAWPASAQRISGMVGSDHDFRNSGKYPGLSAQTGTEICRACHVPHHADRETLLFLDFHQDWAGGTSTFTGSDGLTHRLVLDESLLCMSCHDGTIAAPTRIDHIPDGSLAKVNPAVDPHYWNDKLPVRGYAPAVPYVSEGLELAVQPNGSKWVAVSPVSGTRLPLYTSGADPSPRMACTTCHDPHVENYGGTGKFFLRSDQAYGDLCVTCHSNLYPR
jgi:predicted CXXCH cytochrome family protein